MNDRKYNIGIIGHGKVKGTLSQLIQEKIKEGVSANYDENGLSNNLSKLSNVLPDSESVIVLYSPYNQFDIDLQKVMSKDISCDMSCVVICLRDIDESKLKQILLHASNLKEKLSKNCQGRAYSIPHFEDMIKSLQIYAANESIYETKLPSEKKTRLSKSAIKHSNRMYIDKKKIRNADNRKTQRRKKYF